MEALCTLADRILASMGCAVPYAIAAQLAYPQRQVVAVAGDGGLTMLMGELATVARYRLPVKIVVVRNDSLGQIKWEQMMFLGNPEFECALQPIDFVRAAEAFGLRAWRVERPEDCGAVLDAALAHPGPVLVEAVVDPNEPLLPPKRMPRYADNLRKALDAGTPGHEAIERALGEEPARTQLGPWSRPCPASPLPKGPPCNPTTPTPPVPAVTPCAPVPPTWPWWPARRRGRHGKETGSPMPRTCSSSPH